MTPSSKKAALERAYYVVGTDELKREAVLKRLQSRLSEVGDLAFNSDTIDGASAEEGAVLGACLTAPFLSPLRLVVVNNADKLKKATISEMVAYLKNPSPTTVVVFIANQIKKTDKVFQAVSVINAQSVIRCDPPKSRDLPKLVTAMANERGIELSPAALRRLIDHVGEDTVHLDAEVEKIALAHRGRDPVSEGEVINLVAAVAEVKPWELLDAVSNRDLNKSLRLWHRMQAESPLRMIALMAARIRELIAAYALDQRKEASSLPRALNLKDKDAWKVKNHVRWARVFGGAQLRNALKTLQDAELRIKTGGDGAAIFEQWMITTLKRA